MNPKVAAHAKHIAIPRPAQVTFITILDSYGMVPSHPTPPQLPPNHSHAADASISGDGGSRARLLPPPLLSSLVAAEEVEPPWPGCRGPPPAGPLLFSTTKHQPPAGAPSLPPSGRRAGPPSSSTAPETLACPSLPPMAMAMASPHEALSSHLISSPRISLCMRGRKEGAYSRGEKLLRLPTQEEGLFMEKPSSADAMEESRAVPGSRHRRADPPRHGWPPVPWHRHHRRTRVCWHRLLHPPLALPPVKDLEHLVRVQLNVIYSLLTGRLVSEKVDLAARIQEGEKGHGRATPTHPAC